MPDLPGPKPQPSPMCERAAFFVIGQGGGMVVESGGSQ
jgi:hypothetical protein